MTIANYTANPQSDAARAAYVELLTSGGKYSSAIQVLESGSSSGAYLHYLYLNCLKYGAIDDDSLRQAKIDARGFEKVYPLTGLMEISTLALNNECRLNRELLIEKLEAFSGQRVSIIGWREKLLIHKAYHQYAADDSESALHSLDRAFALNPKSAIPLFLSARWFSELGQQDRALKQFEKAKEVSQESRVDYSEIISEIEEDLGRRIQNQD